RQFRKSWSEYFRRQAQFARTLKQQSDVTRTNTISLAREGNHTAAVTQLHALSKASAANQPKLRDHRRIIRRAQLQFIRRLLQKLPVPDFRSQRKQLLAAQAAGYAALRAIPSRNPSDKAHSEVALEFAHRWAEIRKGPA